LSNIDLFRVQLRIFYHRTVLMDHAITHGQSVVYTAIVILLIVIISVLRLYYSTVDHSGIKPNPLRGQHKVNVLSVLVPPILKDLL
jgi:hypothetical protein